MKDDDIAILRELRDLLRAQNAMMVERQKYFDELLPLIVNALGPKVQISSKAIQALVLQAMQRDLDAKRKDGT